jgi:hypothetical protein
MSRWAVGRHAARQQEAPMQPSIDANNLFPLALTQSDDYRALSPEQRKGLLGRLLHTHELVDASLLGAKASGDEQKEILSELELDAMSVIDLRDPEKGVSAYLVHQSWTFDCSNCRLADYVDPAVFVAVAALQMTVDASPDQVSTWLRQWSAALQATYDRLSRAKVFCEAIAQLIAIDLLVASLLTNIALHHLDG